MHGGCRTAVRWKAWIFKANFLPFSLSLSCPTCMQRLHKETWEVRVCVCACRDRDGESEIEITCKEAAAAAELVSLSQLLFWDLVFYSCEEWVCLSLSPRSLFLLLCPFRTCFSVKFSNKDFFSCSTYGQPELKRERDDWISFFFFCRGSHFLMHPSMLSHARTHACIPAVKRGKFFNFRPNFLLPFSLFLSDRHKCWIHLKLFVNKLAQMENARFGKWGQSWVCKYSFKKRPTRQTQLIPRLTDERYFFVLALWKPVEINDGKWSLATFVKAMLLLKRLPLL